MKKTELKELANVSFNVIARMGKNKTVSIDTPSNPNSLKPFSVSGSHLRHHIAFISYTLESCGL